MAEGRQFDLCILLLQEAIKKWSAGATTQLQKVTAKEQRVIDLVTSATLRLSHAICTIGSQMDPDSCVRQVKRTAFLCSRVFVLAHLTLNDVLRDS